MRSAYNGARGYNRFDWDEYDALPPLIRRVQMYAPVQLGTRRATQNLRYHSVEQVAALEVRVARQALKRIVLKFYGPDHPQVSQ